jgi:hypothetical protein
MKRKDEMADDWIVPDEAWSTFDNDDDWIVSFPGDGEEWELPEWDVPEWELPEWELLDWELPEWNM